MNTSKMKAATMLAYYGASCRLIARIIGARRAKRLIQSIRCSPLPHKVVGVKCDVMVGDVTYVY